MTDEHATGRAGAPLGTVADEAARLVEALGEWARHGEPDAGDAAAEEPAAGEPDTGPARAGTPPPSPGHDHGTCPTCGSEAGIGRAASCRVCPVCQAITVLRSVRPETVDRLADLAGAVSAGLRDLATTARAGEGQQEPADEQHAERRTRTDVEDIPVTGEDEEML